MYFNGYLYGLTPDPAAVEAHTLPDEAGIIRNVLTFKEALKEAIMCLFYLE
jgi:hypothetical protein